MAKTAIFLTPEDRDLLADVIHDFRTRPRNTRNSGEQFTVSGSPEVYVAKLPSSGIPERSGTVPGHATCDIYKIDVTTPSTPTMTAATSVTRDVYNTYPVKTYCGSGVATYVQIQRDKFGRWLCEKPPYRYKAKPTANIGVGSSGPTNLYIAGSVAGSVTAYLNWMAGGDQISSGKEAIVEYFEDEQHWCFVEAECE